MTIVQSINLQNQNGNSDKVYNVELRQVTPSSYNVVAFNGRRGSTLVERKKTNSPVEYNKAVKIYDDLVNSKLKDGYSVANGGSSTASAPTSPKRKGLMPQLLNAINSQDLMKYINDPDFMAQEKKDGVRLMIQKEQDDIYPSNKLGNITSLAISIRDAIQALPMGYATLDGEAIGDHYYVFDALNIDSKFAVTSGNAEKRMAMIKKHIPSSEFLHIVETAYTTEEKLALYNRIVDEGGEGIVFKRKSAAYIAGRPSSYGDQLKFKFVETASCEVTAIHPSKRSVSIGLYNNGVITEVGNVTIPPNKVIPAAGAVVEVRYLYAYREGSLFQPVYLTERDDILNEECDISQLKYKQELKAA